MSTNPLYVFLPNLSFVSANLFLQQDPVKQTSGYEPQAKKSLHQSSFARNNFDPLWLRNNAPFLNQIDALIAVIERRRTIAEQWFVMEVVAAPLFKLSPSCGP